MKPGVYRHYKDRLYLVIDSVTHTETGEELVIYRALYGERRLWARPAQMFLDNVTLGQSLVSRFTYVSGTEEANAT